MSNPHRPHRSTLNHTVCHLYCYCINQTTNPAEKRARPQAYESPLYLPLPSLPSDSPPSPYFLATRTGPSILMNQHLGGSSMTESRSWSDSMYVPCAGSHDCWLNLILYTRPCTEEFSPLKNAPGTADDPETSRRHLLVQHCWFLGRLLALSG